MKEINHQSLVLPPSWCGSICRNAMSEVCVEHCAIKRDCSGFLLRQGINLIDLPRFPIDSISEMTKEEKFTSVAVYLAKTIDHLKGVEDEPVITIFGRSNHDRSGSRALPQDLKGENVLPGVPETDPPLPPGTECESEKVRPPEVAGSED